MIRASCDLYSRSTYSNNNKYGDQDPATDTYIDSTGDRSIKSNPPVIMIPCELMTPHKETYPHGLMQAKQLIGRRDPWYAFRVDSGLARTFY